MIALLDGDIITFRAGFTAEEDELWIAIARAKKLVDDICNETESSAFRIFVSGTNNFRYTVFPEYKANRIGAARPKWEKDLKAHMVSQWSAEVADGCEADDLMGVNQTDNTIICTIDKDLDQIPGWHYNFVKKLKYFVSEDAADWFFYYQTLIGDSADGIKGCKGIGPKKATKLLDKGNNEEEWFNIVRETYNNDIEFEMNAKCLRIWRTMNEDWSIENQTAKFQSKGATNAANNS